jgi:hypothetical protein
MGPRAGWLVYRQGLSGTRPQIIYTYLQVTTEHVRWISSPLRVSPFGEPKDWLDDQCFNTDSLFLIVVPDSPRAR